MRDALLALLAEERRKFMAGGGLCMNTVLQALVETREASLQVVEAITRCAQQSIRRRTNKEQHINRSNIRIKKKLLFGNRVYNT